MHQIWNEEQIKHARKHHCHANAKPSTHKKARAVITTARAIGSERQANA
jgi:hypothetical protein